MNRRIMVAVEGSINSCYAIDYLCLVLAGMKDISIHLFSHGGPASPFYCPEQETLFPAPSSTGAEEEKERSLGYIERATRKFLRHGFCAERITLKLDSSSKPVAEAILEEVEGGVFDSVVVGRRGWGAIAEMFLESVSREVLKKSHNTPLWIVNGKVTSPKFLVPVDGSVNSLLAVDHLAYMIKDSPFIEVYLFHSRALFSEDKEIKRSDFYPYWDKKWCAEYVDGTGEDRWFEAPKQILKEAGFPEARVRVISPSLHIEASLDILSQAAAHDCGTIVVGRRGAEVPTGILRRVSNSIVKKAENLAVWIVG